jgi:5-methylthioribose kinase
MSSKLNILKPVCYLQLLNQTLEKPLFVPLLSHSITELQKRDIYKNIDEEINRNVKIQKKKRKTNSDLMEVRDRMIFRLFIGKNNNRKLLKINGFVRI